MFFCLAIQRSTWGCIRCFLVYLFQHLMETVGRRLHGTQWTGVRGAVHDTALYSILGLCSRTEDHLAPQYPKCK